MRSTKAAWLLAMIAVGILAAETASAQGGHRYGSHRHGPRVHFGFVFGPPVYWHYPGPYNYYPPPYYYHPPVVAAPAAPTTYIERGDARSGPEQAQDYWYYCPEAQAYYPYVKQCAGGWQKVAPQPPS